MFCRRSIAPHKKKISQWLKRGFYALVAGIAVNMIVEQIGNFRKNLSCFEVKVPELNAVLASGQTLDFEFERACETDRGSRWLLFITEEGRWYYSIAISCEGFDTLRVFVPPEMHTLEVHATIFACEAESHISRYLTQASQGDRISTGLINDGLSGNECDQFKVGDYNILLEDGSTPVILPTPTPGVTVPLKTHYSFPPGKRSLRNRDLIQGETGRPIARTWLALECQGRFYPTARLSSVGLWSHYIAVPPHLVGSSATIVILNVSVADDKRLSLANRETPDGVILVDGFTYVQKDAVVELRRE